MSVARVSATISGETWSWIAPCRTKRRSSLETPPGLLRLRKALTSRLVSKTALYIQRGKTSRHKRGGIRVYNVGYGQDAGNRGVEGGRAAGSGSGAARARNSRMD